MIDYFNRWTAKWPTVAALADASQEEVRPWRPGCLAAWRRPWCKAQAGIGMGSSLGQHHPAALLAPTCCPPPPTAHRRPPPPTARHRPPPPAGQPGVVRPGLLPAGEVPAGRRAPRARQAGGPLPHHGQGAAADPRWGGQAVGPWWGCCCWFCGSAPKHCSGRAWVPCCSAAALAQRSGLTAPLPGASRRCLCGRGRRGRLHRRRHRLHRVRGQGGRGGRQRDPSGVAPARAGGCACLLPDPRRLLPCSASGGRGPGARGPGGGRPCTRSSCPDAAPAVWPPACLAAGDPRKLGAVHAELAQQLLDAQRPGCHNQAMMELGALAL